MGWNNCQIDCAAWAPNDELVRDGRAILALHLALVKEMNIKARTT
jgi:hypothetical protein